MMWHVARPISSLQIPSPPLLSSPPLAIAVLALALAAVRARPKFPRWRQVGCGTMPVCVHEDVVIISNSPLLDVVNDWTVAVHHKDSKRW
eukprot:3888119-Pyramimonas_sp.AAC.1